MDLDHVRAYAGRDWELVAALKLEHWARETASRGSAAAFEAAEALRAHMCHVRPDWPTADDRARDLAHHVALKSAIDRAAGAALDARRR